MSVRVRFAPSPTGYLHVGGLRTALYNYLFAKNHNGSCILRIEDTDRTRFVENAQENLIKSLEWAGITFDEGPGFGGQYGPYIQSERLDIYKKFARKLLKQDSAYYAFDTPEQIEDMRTQMQKSGKDPRYDRSIMNNQYTLGPEETKKRIDSGEKYVVRLKVDHDSTVEFDDIIRGHISVPGKDIDDQVLLKSDGFPTYHLANITDDHLMGITHVIRGEEWLPSTPKHVILYNCLGLPIPQFAHLPLLLNEKKAKLSKRHGSVAVEDFIEQGYIRDAFVNFIALLGWNPSGDREIYSIDELIETFNLSKVNKGGAVFDTKKLEWMNQQYLKNSDNKKIAEMLKPIVKEKELGTFADEYLAQVASLFKERVTFAKEIIDNADYMFRMPAEYEEKYIQKHWKEDTRELVEPLTALLAESDNFTHDNTYSITKNYVEERELKLKNIIHPIRLMITGKSVGAGMFETMEVLGREECLKRFRYFLDNEEKITAAVNN